MSAPVSTRILLIEDSPTDARLLKHDLTEVTGGAFEVTWVERLEDATAKLRERSFDVALLDLTLPDSSGIVTYTRVQKEAPRLPVVVLTGADNEATGIEAIRRGVQEYLVKGAADGKTVARAIRYAIERKQMQEELFKANKLLEQRLDEILIAKEALNESEHRFRLALKNAPVSLAAQDMDLRFIWAYNQHTINPDEVIGKTDTDIFSPEDAAYLMDIKRKVIDTGAELRQQRWITSNGQSRFLDLYIEPLRGAGGRVTGVAVATVDMTQEKIAQDALRQVVLRLDALSQTASALLQSTDPQRHIQSLCRTVMERIECDTFFNFLVDEKAGKLHLNAYAGIPEKEARKVEWLDFGVAVCGCVARDGRRIVAEHIPSSDDARTELVKSWGIKRKSWERSRSARAAARRLPTARFPL